MILENLIPVKFVKRYKRFFMDGQLENGDVVVAHCPNTGSMKTLLDEADEVWLRYEDNPKRKLKYTAEILKLKSGALALINTQRPNTLVEEFVKAGQFQGTRVEFLSQVQKWKREVKYGNENSKIDLWGEIGEGQEVFLEVKNMTLMDFESWGSFPDAKTERGQKHLRELSEMIQSKGHRSILCFLASRSDLNSYGVASHIDPKYGALFEEAKSQGVVVWTPQLQFEVIESQEGRLSVEMKIQGELDYKENPHPS